MIKKKVYVAHMLLCRCRTREGFTIKESLCGTHAFVQLQDKGRFYNKRESLCFQIFTDADVIRIVSHLQETKFHICFFPFCFNNACNLTDPQQNCRECVG